jgi:hypothetical protein
MGELKLFCGPFKPSRRRLERVNVHGWTFSRKDGPEAAQQEVGTP